jgi:hypothetical protein
MKYVVLYHQVWESVYLPSKGLAIYCATYTHILFHYFLPTTLCVRYTKFYEYFGEGPHDSFNQEYRIGLAAWRGCFILEIAPAE